ARHPAAGGAGPHRAACRGGGRSWHRRAAGVHVPQWPGDETPGAAAARMGGGRPGGADRGGAGGAGRHAGSAQLRGVPGGEHRAGSGRCARGRGRTWRGAEGQLMYQAPLRDLRFVMDELLASESVLAPAWSDTDYSSELAGSVLEEAGNFAETVLHPLNAPGDQEGARWTPEGVVMPKGFREAYQSYVEAGW